jgi:retron-type reverse transcriptase
MEPIFETDFYPSSYGYRPGRRAQDAIAEIHRFTSNPSNSTRPHRPLPAVSLRQPSRRPGS